MEKFISLQETNAGKMPHCNKDTCAGCRNKQEIQQGAVANQADDDIPNIFRLYYAALLQGYSYDIRNGNQETGYLHCT
jgi:hypothetical protein